MTEYELMCRYIDLRVLGLPYPEFREAVDKLGEKWLEEHNYLPGWW